MGGMEQTPEVTVVASRTAVDDSTTQSLPSGAGVTVTPESVGVTGGVDVRTVEWQSDPHGWSSAASDVSGRIVSVTMSESGTGNDITSVPEPLVVTLTIPEGTDIDTFQCGFWSDSAGECAVRCCVDTTAVVCTCWW